jgi:hypothetical protein
MINPAEGVSMSAQEWQVGDVFTRDGDLAEHKVLATCEDGLRVLVRRQAFGLARSFQYFMDARVAAGQERKS